ncbi:MAG: zinc-ribbon domain-containing protein [Lachnospiraceae bacterium]|nr:zinc-ribbon domain-containing protein [Lachnospiraceae bacterium]
MDKLLGGTMMYCSNCGAKIEEGSKFCTNCGVQLSAQKQPAMKPHLTLTNDGAPAETKPSQPSSKIQLDIDPPIVEPPFDVGIKPENAGISHAAAQQPRQTGAAAYAAGASTQATAAANTQAQPDAAQMYADSHRSQAAASKATTPRDGRGKYILKRLLFFGIALVIAIASAFLLRIAFPRIGGDYSRGMDRVLGGLGATAFILIASLIVAFIIGMLAGLAKGHTGKNVVRVISVILRAFVPMSLGYILIETFAVQTRLLPVRSNNMIGMILPMLSMILPLAGFLMNAAVSNGHRTTFAGGIGAVAAWIADHIVIIVLFEVIVEWMFMVPGLGYLTQRSIMNMDVSTLFTGVLALMILILLLKLINDIIASLVAGGDPTEQVFGVRFKVSSQAGATAGQSGTSAVAGARGQIKKDKSGKVLLIIGIICAGLVVAGAIAMAFTSTHTPEEIDINGAFLAPGQRGHVLGTDGMGRDIYALLASGVFYTILGAFVNTIIAIILGVGFGLLAGFLRGAGAEVFKAIRYIFGFGAPLAIMIFILLIIRGSIIPAMGLVGLYGWGGIADRLAGAIKAKKAHPGEKTSLILPVLEQVVHTFCIAVIGITIMGMSGLLSYFPYMQTLGTLLASSQEYLVSYPFLAVAPAFALTIILAAFFLMHAGLSARERYLK